MYDKLTENDIKKMQEEIDYRKPLTLFQIPQRTTKSASTRPSRFTLKKMMRQKPTNLSPPFVVILSKDTSVSTRH